MLKKGGNMKIVLQFQIISFLCFTLRSIFGGNDFFPITIGVTTSDSCNCQNGGLCRVGEESGEDHKCDCPRTHFGDFCEHPAEPCGENFCLHGSKCFEINLEHKSKKEHLCDCTAAYTATTYYSGEFCQYPSTTFCSGINDPNGRQFCTNNGRCADGADATHEPCICPVGYAGPRCAFAIGKDGSDYAECKLSCENGGTCQKGVKNLEAYGKFANEISHLIDHDKAINEAEHCVCPNGFFGIRCEYEVEECNNGKHLCFHGSQCVEEDAGCDCESSNRDTAGVFCEYFATEQCTQVPLINESHRGFCTNGGSCKQEKNGSLKCSCPTGYRGEHCEFKTKETENLQVTSLSGLWLVIGGLLCFGMAVLYRSRRGGQVTRNGTPFEHSTSFSSSII